MITSQPASNERNLLEFLKFARNLRNNCAYSNGVFESTFDSYFKSFHIHLYNPFYEKALRMSHVRFQVSLICLCWFTIHLGANAFSAEPLPDIRSIEPDLSVVKMTEGEPAPGKRVRQVLPKYAKTQVHHSLYLPTDWEPGKKYPVFVEYAGNGPYKNKYGDISTGKVEDCKLGYGLSAGQGVIWLVLPYISKDHQQNQLQWFGDLQATVDYCKEIVPQVCEQFGGDPDKVILMGFSRGAIACNVIGLHDDEIAKLWAGFLCHSHYHGPRKWRFEGSDRATAIANLKRLKDRPQFISHEGSVTETKKFLEEAYPAGNFTFLDFPFRNHTDLWVLRETQARKQVRQWLQDIYNSKATANAKESK